MASISNAVMGFLVGTAGLPLMGAELLDVRGRKSGEVRSVVVNPLEIDGATYLMSARGESQWVKNLRASGEGRLRRGRKNRSFRQGLCARSGGECNGMSSSGRMDV